MSNFLFVKYLLTDEKRLNKMKKVKLLLILFLICLSLFSVFLYFKSLSNPCEKETKIVTKVIDGDTIIVEGGETIRLLGIDADEKGYSCYYHAKKELENMILNKSVRLECDVKDKDIYGRYLRYVFKDDENINVWMVKNGLAIARIEDAKKYEKEILEAERYAKENHIGCKWK
jgi:endonuclease YncB( thermonuclease family)